MKADPRGSSPMTARTLGTCTQTNGATSKRGGVAPRTARPELSAVRSSRMTRTSPGRAGSPASPRRQETVAPIFRSRERASSRATASAPTPTPVGSIQTRRRAEGGHERRGGGRRHARPDRRPRGPGGPTPPPRRRPPRIEASVTTATATRVDTASLPSPPGRPPRRPPALRVLGPCGSGRARAALSCLSCAEVRAKRG